MQHVGLIGHCLRLSLWQVWAEWSGPKLRWSRVERWAGLRKIGRSVSEGPRSGNGAVSGGQKNQVLCGAAKPSAPLRSHALVPKRWGIPPDSESGGIHLSLVIVDSHFIDWGTTQGRLSLPTADVLSTIGNLEVNISRQGHVLCHALGDMMTECIHGWCQA